MIALASAVLLWACHDSPTGPSNQLSSARIAYLVNDQLHVVDLDGSHDTIVTPSVTRVKTYSWHAATQRVVYRTYEPVVHILDRQTGTDRVVTSLPHPEYIYAWEWSPDGNRLLVVDSTRIIIVSATGDNPVTLAPTIDFGRAASWSPNGQFIAATGSTGAVLLIPLDGSAVQQIQLPSWIYNPRFSPDGASLAFDSDGGIWVASTATLAAHRIIAPGCTIACGQSGNELFGTPHWSPDGSRLAGAKNFSIWTSAADGSSLKEFASSGPSLTPWSPMWSSDGSMIAFVDHSTAGADIFVMRPDGSASSQVTHSGAAQLPSWVPRR